MKQFINENNNGLNMIIHGFIRVQGNLLLIVFLLILQAITNVGLTVILATLMISCFTCVD